MAELACANEPSFEVSRTEESAARSYSILTIEKLEAAGMGPLAFLIGADAFADIQTWHRWQDVVERVEFIVVTRPGAAYTIPPAARIRELNALSLPISSSDIRMRLQRGDDNVPLAPPVFDYIREHGLYRSQRS